jgi:hypothetical protein
VLAACADVPSAPTSGLAAQSAQLGTGGPAATPAANTPASAAAIGVLRDEPLAQDITAQQTIGPEGGVLQIPEAGMTLEVPAGAVQEPTVFTATALAGRAVAYDFGPSGTFPVALTVRQDMSGTNWNKHAVNALTAAYVRDLTTIDRSNGTAHGDEAEPTNVDPSSSTVTFTVTHFSGYMVSTGRCFGWY